MAETIGKITNVKVASFLPGSVNSFDVGAITLKETSTGTSWLFYVWNTRDDAPALQRVLNSQRLSLVREAAFRSLVVHAFHDNDSQILTEITVDIP
jgi:hypothetical protein